MSANTYVPVVAIIVIIYIITQCCIFLSMVMQHVFNYGEHANA